MFFADVEAAYKLLTVNEEEWNLQVFQIGSEYFVDKTGIFGDVAAGDNWDRFESRSSHSSKEVELTQSPLLRR